MVTCAAIKGDGARCRARAINGSGWCFNHDPDRSEARRRNAQKGGRMGGRGRPKAEITELKREIRAVAKAVLTGELETGRAAVGLQAWNTLLRAVEIERRTEMYDLLERIEQLEAHAKRVQHGA
jgi:hypothetical protein